MKKIENSFAVTGFIGKSPQSPFLSERMNILVSEVISRVIYMFACSQQLQFQSAYL